VGSAEHAVVALGDEILAANAAYADDFRLAGYASRPTRQFAVVTCMDCRLDPVAFLGLAPGDAHVLRNAGGVVSDDVLRSLAVSHGILGTKEAVVIGHTGCGMQQASDDVVRSALAEAVGIDAKGADFLSFPDVEEAVRTSVRRIRESPLLPSSFGVSGYVYDIETGRISPIA
jgi:carbonic anhydrase